MTSEAERVQAARAARLEKATGAELAGWQQMAQTWPLRFCVEDPYARCEACDQAVIRLVDDTGTGYLYSHAELLTLMVAHIRQVHAGTGGLPATTLPLALCFVAESPARLGTLACPGTTYRLREVDRCLTCRWRSTSS